MKIIRSTRHNLPYTANVGKQVAVSAFLDLANTALKSYVDHLWENEVVFKDLNGAGDVVFSVTKDFLEAPSYIPHDVVKAIEVPQLSARALSHIANQAWGIVRAQTNKKQKLKDKLVGVIDPRRIEKLRGQLDKFKLTKPTLKESVGIELSGKCASFVEFPNSKEFYGFVELYYLGSACNDFSLPIQRFARADKYASHPGTWSRLNSFLVHKDRVEVRWEKVPTESKYESVLASATISDFKALCTAIDAHSTSGIFTQPTPTSIREKVTAGADSGFKSVLTIADSQDHCQQTPTCDGHAHSLESICKKLARKQKGSKAFRRAQSHRKNFVNWSINQLDLSHIDQLNFEEVVNIFLGRCRSKVMSAWANALIEDKVTRVAAEGNVSLKLNGSAYRSQRCSRCSLVRKANRKSKHYVCVSCGLEVDADVNASINHILDLPRIPTWVFRSGLNRQGFYWTLSGFYSLDGQELRVPDVPQTQFIFS